LLEVPGGFSGAGRTGNCSKGDSVKRKDVDENLIQHLHGGKVHAPDKAEDCNTAYQHTAVQDTRRGGRKVSSATVEDDACRKLSPNDKGENRCRSAGKINEKRDEEDISGNLKIGKKRKVRILQQVRVDTCQHVNRQNEIIKIGRRERIDSIFMLKEDERSEQKSDEHDPAHHLPFYPTIIFLS
jgi:hypothetical protein